jgi:hypothetical protein
MKWFNYEIDYEYGKATLLSKDRLKEPLVKFNNLASECFGIRKSIGETKLLDEKFEEITMNGEAPKSDNIARHPDLYSNPIQVMVENMKYPYYEIKQEWLENGEYILIHSGGDVIVFDKDDKKIKSEFD